jgi:hypothetical protein
MSDPQEAALGSVAGRDGFRIVEATAHEHRMQAPDILSREVSSHGGSVCVSPSLTTPRLAGDFDGINRKVAWRGLRILFTIGRLTAGRYWCRAVKAVG